MSLIPKDEMSLHSCKVSEVEQKSWSDRDGGRDDPSRNLVGCWDMLTSTSSKILVISSSSLAPSFDKIAAASSISKE